MSIKRGRDAKNKAQAMSKRSKKAPDASVDMCKRKGVFRFLDMPSELRNRVYFFTMQDKKQALLQHLPKKAALRHRKGQQARPTNRPYLALTQICRQLRYEYRPIYMATQEIGIDMADVQHYIRDYYHNPSPCSHVGNLTIAVSEDVKDMALHEGQDIWPLMSMWALSRRVEAGFGRYHRDDYNPSNDGECKDLYRLFGRRVLPNRQCGRMNMPWKRVLREGKLSAVRVYRQRGINNTRPYIHLLFKSEHKEAWMDREVAKIPNNWLNFYGFDGMEHFDVKVGVTGRLTVTTQEETLETGDVMDVDIPVGHVSAEEF